MITYSIKTIFWISCVTIVSYGLPSNHDKDPKMLLNDFGYMNESASQDTLANTYQEVPARIEKFQTFHGLNETEAKAPFSGNDEIEDIIPVSKEDDVEDKEPQSLELIRSKRHILEEICDNAIIDTITSLQNGETYAFKGNFFYKLLADGIAPGYPKRIDDYWGGLPGNLDASFSTPDGKTYFFKGSSCWRYTNRVRDASYPKPIAEEFEGIPDNLDAAFYRSVTNITYFFKDNQYWRYSTKSTPPVESDYPKPNTIWSYWAANGINAALGWIDGHTYFFKGQEYIRYNDESETIEHGYPRFTAPHWFDCNCRCHQCNRQVNQCPNS